ncbi:protein of unknown function [Methylorubrum extorquens]|uniref:Uncharacterized protein n=1 Tax=Methylorubrum extorquens TaxID=408 RepID=A0A2N9AHL8_METEX|nr:protein of unknown function [Methylorubrum extorquens]
MPCQRTLPVNPAQLNHSGFSRSRGRKYPRRGRAPREVSVSVKTQSPPGSRQFRPQARSEITIGPLTTFARETPEEVVRAPWVERGPLKPGT